MTKHPSRKIIHIDMDCFFVAVEIRDNPSLQGIPVAVGGHPGKRGVIATCNYEARQFGVRSAMASSRAKILCPNLIILSGNMANYQAVSQQIRKIFARHTNIIEPLSLDEAYLDVTEAKHCNGSATMIAEKIRQEIKSKLKLTASAGVGPNKLIAKIASDINKPDGICVIPPAKVAVFVRDLPVSKLFGVGKVALTKLKQLKITTCCDMQSLSEHQLTELFGKFGNSLYSYCRGIDHREVNPSRVRKSMSVEHTYESDLHDETLFQQSAVRLVIELKKRLKSVKNRKIKNIFVKLKFSDFNQTTAEAQANELDSEIINQLILKAYVRHSKPVRLLGVGVNFIDEATSDVTDQIGLDFRRIHNKAMEDFLMETCPDKQI